MLREKIVLTKKQSLTQTTVSKLKKLYIAFDVETTGLYPNIHKIIEIGAVLFEDGKIIKTFGTLVNPGVPVPRRATAINHITNAKVKAVPKEEV